MLDFVCGVIGFLGFEAIRIYKCQWAGRSVVPLKRRWLYAGTLFALGVFSGCVAFGIAGGNAGRALFIGFSVPTGIRTLLEPSQGQRSHEVHVDDTDLSRPARVWRVTALIREYFWG
jgi:hypothetical protein